MSSHEYRLPDVGEGVAEGELLQWYVEAGDEVEEDEVIAEVETDKAVADLPSPVDGTVAEVLFEEGATVPVGEVFVVFDVPDGEASEATDESRAETSEPTPEPTENRRSAVETTESATTPSADEGANAQPSGSTTPTTNSETAQAGSRQEGSTGRDRTLATPPTRRVAHELDIDINEVPSAEKRDGEAFVTKDAVRAFAEGGAGEEDSVGTDAAGADGARQPSEERVPYRGVRRTIGEQMERSKFTIPHVTTVDEADVTGLVTVRERLAPVAEARGSKLTYLTFVIRAAGNTLREFPLLNASLDTDAEEIVLKNDYNIGVATETEDGLRVPVVDAVDEKGLLRIADEVNEVTRKAREGTISRAEMQGGTFTITNIGPYGGEHGTPVINHPETAIVSMGRIEERPRVVDGEVVPRHVMNLSLSFDHRVIDGATAAQFLNTLKEHLETPELLLLE